MSTLIVRMYNVLQGDAILITVPDRAANGHEIKRHILIDVGNLNGNAVYEQIVKDIRKEAGEVVDLYVMTHKHKDHVEGLPYAKHELKLPLRARYSWLTASAAPDYYQTHPEAHRAMALADEAYTEIARYMAATDEDDPHLRDLLALNSLDETDRYVDYLRTIAPEHRTFYVHRETEDLEHKHPFAEAKLTILAPEEDTADYFKGLRSLALGITDGDGARARPRVEPLDPPQGVDAGAFHELVDLRRRGFVDGLRSIDAAKNDTSIVFSLRWRDWRLLFCGDAQEKSWDKMYEHCRDALGPVHFLKVGHHGSHNATPSPLKIRKKLFGQNQPCAVIPVGPNTFKHPHKQALDRLKRAKCDISRTDEVAPGGYIDFEFDG